MRPLNRGPIPEDDQKRPIQFNKYAQARRYLIDRMGEYCAYCERRIVASLAVEHVKPKALHPGLGLDWNNFLLGCTNCNSTKGDKPISLPDYVWPDADPTLEYFDYLTNPGEVRVHKSLTNKVLHHRILATIKLVGLDKLPPSPHSSNWQIASDRRYAHRQRSIANAAETATLYANAPEKERATIRGLISIIVKGEGFWSIWMHTFKDFPEVVAVLLDSLPGTDQKRLFP